MKVLRVILPILLLIYSLQSQAATAYTDSAGTTLIGFFDVSVNGVLYDVTFVDGTYDAVFGSLPLTFSGVTEARTALDALDDAIAQYPAWGDHTAGTPIGISPSSSDWGFFLPYEITPSDLVLALILQHDNIPDIPNIHMFIGIETSYDTTDSTGGVWAKWEQVGVVPVPAAVWLFSSGLLGLIGFSRRKKIE